MHRNHIERNASKRWRGSARRIIAACVYNLSCFTHGCSTGWVSGVLGNEALTGGAWLAALPCLVALPAAPFFAVLADARGRKAGAFCSCISFIISWSLAAWCGQRGVWAARVAAGAGGAGALALAPVYCAEIAPRTRGLAAMPALACSCGILFAYAAGGALSAHALSLSMAVPPSVLLVSLIWLPETPSFLISIGRVQDAAKVLCWFDGSDFGEDLTDIIEQQEIRIRTSEFYGGRREAMRRHDSDTFQPMLKRTDALVESNTEQKSGQSICRELFRHRRSRRALFSCCVVLSAAAGSGVGAVNSYATAVLRHSAHAVPLLNMTAYNFSIYNGSLPRPLFESSEAGSILCGTALVLGAAVATVTVDKLGRKMLLMCSCSGITCCLALLGAYCDPHFRLYSWYSDKPILHRYNNSLKDKSFQLAEYFTDDRYDNATVKNYLNASAKALHRINITVNGMLNEMAWIQRSGANGTVGIDNDDTVIFAPVLLLSIVLFLYNIGLGSVPYVLISELFSINVRSLASSLLISWTWLSSFLLLRYYGTIAVFLGLHSIYYLCASITFLGALYIYLVIPETKGKSREEIVNVLDGPILLLRRGRRKNDNQR